MNVIRIKTPLNAKTASELKSSDRVKIAGKIFTARDAAHKKLVELISLGEELPIDIKNQVIYYAGPAPAKPGYVIGPAGPTTSGRMDDYTITLLAAGLKGVIGKGVRSKAVKAGLIKFKAVYFAAVGGAAALLSQKIKKAKVVAFPELGPEAIFELEVEDFPVVVVNDIYGNDLYEMGIQNYLRNER
jgi:fumarate hydratase subunit beta